MERVFKREQKMKLQTTELFKQLSLSNKELIVLDNEQIKKLQNAILSIADDVIDICEKNNINYHLTGGSALGAIRHNGFIPWDDDMDIDVARKDYDKLIKLIKEQYGDKYYIHNPKNKDGFNIPATQIRSKNSIVRGCTDADDRECGAYIDIAIIENTFDNSILRKIHGIGSLTLGFIVSCRKFYKDRKYLLKLVKDNREARKIFKIKINFGRFFSFLTLRRWTIIYDCWNKICKNENTKMVTVPTGRKHFFGELYNREDFFLQTKHKFEGRMWNVPKGYDNYLTQMYGEYMKIPEESKRERHVLVNFKI